MKPLPLYALDKSALKPLTKVDRWIRWSWQGDRKCRSVASIPLRHWRSYFEVRDWSHLGFILGDGVGAIDLDDCVSETGRVEDWARTLSRRQRRIANSP